MALEYFEKKHVYERLGYLNDRGKIVAGLKFRPRCIEKVTRRKIANSIDDGGRGFCRGCNRALSNQPDTGDSTFFKDPRGIFQSLEIGFTIIFTIELIIRLRFERPIKYLFSVFGVIDVLSILPSLVGANSLALRVLRLFRVFKLFRSRRTVRAIDEIKAAIWDIRSDLVLFGFVVLILLSVCCWDLYV